MDQVGCCEKHEICFDRNDCDICRQSALIRELVEGLEKLQWGGGSTEWAKPRYRLCGECNGDALKGHKPDCWLSALIKRGREAK